ncbi:MAG: hypothetical protein ACI87E_003489 [Mariniblastus sp.]|jgi:hypothetical protein
MLQVVGYISRFIALRLACIPPRAVLRTPWTLHMGQANASNKDLLIGRQHTQNGNGWAA